MILYPKMTSQYDNIAEWLQEGILAAKAGQVEQARFRLLDVVEQDQTNEAAWFWLYQVFDRPDDKQVCLENLLIINPDNQWARQELFNYVPPADAPAFDSQAIAVRNGKPAVKQKSKASIRTERPLVLKIVTAFWVGISLIFLSGGIIASGEWLASTIRSRNFPHYLTGGQTFELLVALLFVVVGLVGLNVALALLLRSMIGFYGSLLLALGLLLIGPTISLIANPPNYPVMICTGGMAGMVVLLTLASQPGFKDT
jgi:hypothetical protein